MASPTGTLLWKYPDLTIEQLNQRFDYPNMGQVLGFVFTELGPDYICGRMPVDHRTRQPAGLWHGGATVVLAETLGSVASFLALEPGTGQAVGLEVNANHLRAVTEGHVTGRCTPIRLGRTIHVWDIQLTDDAGHRIAVSRLTVAIVTPR